MYCLYKDTDMPVEYVSCGNLVNDNGFVHPKRNLDTYVLLLCIKGCLNIYSNNVKYELRPNQYLILLPGTTHFGYKPSTGYLSYYWVHFYIHDPSFKLISVKDSLDIINQYTEEKKFPDVLLLPESGTISNDVRPIIYFSQLLDITKRDHYIVSNLCHMSLSVLLMELSHNYIETKQNSTQNLPALITDIIEWIRKHADEQLQVKDIAQLFNYNPTYLSNLFKKYTGYSLLHYIQRIRISTAKTLLEDRRFTIAEIAQIAGYPDKKYFTRLFKKYEGITPNAYRYSFHEKKLISK